MQITTEITSSAIASDGPIHSRLLYAYEAAKKFVHGNLLEVGCGEGRGIEALTPYCTFYTAIDKNEALLNNLSQKYPQYTFIHGNVPPFSHIASQAHDTVVAFQVIEHIKNDHLFLKEIQRVLTPEGVAIITTPNIHKTLTRNPWHQREYTPEQLLVLMKKYFSHVEVFGICGNAAVWEYYNENKKSVQKITRWDVLNLQYRLPASLLRIPYDLLNRLNRDKLMHKNQNLVSSIGLNDYFLSEKADDGFDLFYVAKK